MDQKIPTIDELSFVPPNTSAFLHAFCDEDRARIDVLTRSVERLAAATERQAASHVSTRAGGVYPGQFVYRDGVPLKIKNIDQTMGTHGKALVVGHDVDEYWDDLAIVSRWPRVPV